MARPRAERGFTLLELLLVLVIVAAGYAMVVRLNAGGVSGAELKSAARAVAAGLRDARGTAIATQESAALTLDLENRSMEVSGGRRARTLPQRLDLKLYTAQSEIVDDKHGAIRFYPDGSSTGGRVTLASGERKFLVDVDWLTGRVTIKEGG
ncbi:MAG: prepilin-type N-terminal cleavage/methylation domain-containing protein [Betaproteobacteria bacterium]|jgi:general secretion pathway protein H|nr:prepilin-type N-terminal cleavage/methylation domain-containing protein [Betaproteobacteria bacterium]